MYMRMVKILNLSIKKWKKTQIDVYETTYNNNNTNNIKYKFVDFK